MSDSPLTVCELFEITLDDAKPNFPENVIAQIQKFSDIVAASELGQQEVNRYQDYIDLLPQILGLLMTHLSSKDYAQILSHKSIIDALVCKSFSRFIDDTDDGEDMLM